ncbi:MAG: NAD(P)-binding protein, partial [Proteobacteria bacterium]|nr:NAD(P)-binding protein [Pseudomonadota bacterium]MBU1710320.1 NAD(P)-binding protein [Pseudomonadota bacterium]
MDKSIIIIGAGIAGLSAGCYARMNGYRTRIFELHDKPGGLCTAWKRNGYTFDGCVHWLVGTRPQTRYNLMWQELGAVQGREIIQHQEFMRVEARGGKCFTCYSDLDKLEGHMKDLSPADDEIITEFCNAARALVPLGEPMDEGLSGAAYGIKVGLMMLPLMPIFEKYSRITVQEFAGRFKDPFLRYAFPITFDQPDFSMLAMLMTLAWMHCGDAGYPVGGSLPFARSIEKRYLDLGGEVHYKKRVLEIIVEDDTAVGVCLADGTEHRADRLISAGDGHNTIFSLLHGRYTNETIRKYYNTLPIFASQIQVSLGVSGDFSDQPHKAVIQPSEVIEVAGEILDRISIRHYGYDPTMAPNGKSVL